MRKKNRKKTVNSLVPQVPFAAVLVCFVLASLAYVWLVYCADSLGRELKKLESKREVLVQRRLNAEYRWSQKTTPPSIRAALKKHKLVMTWPTRDQIVILREPSFDAHGLARLNSELLEPPRLGRIVMND